MTKKLTIVELRIPDKENEERLKFIVLPNVELKLVPVHEIYHSKIEPLSEDFTEEFSDIVESIDNKTVNNTELVDRIEEAKDTLSEDLKNLLLILANMNSNSTLFNLANKTIQYFNSFITIIKKLLLTIDEGEEARHSASDSVLNCIKEIVELAKEAAIQSEEDDKIQTEKDLLFDKYSQPLSQVMSKLKETLEALEAIEPSSNRDTSKIVIGTSFRECLKLLEFLFFTKINQHKISLETLYQYSEEKANIFNDICDNALIIADKKNEEALKIAVEYLNKSCDVSSKFENDCLNVFPSVLDAEFKNDSVNEIADADEKEQFVLQKLLFMNQETFKVFNGLQNLLNGPESAMKFVTNLQDNKSALLMRLDLESNVTKARMILEFNEAVLEDLKKTDTKK